MIENDTLLRLAEHPNIVGMKDCCADRAQSIDLLRRRPAGFRVLTGEDAQYHNALIDGADGAILLSAHIETEAFAAVRTLLWEGNREARVSAVAGGRRTDQVVVRRAEPGAGEVLAGAQRADRQRGSAAADGGGERGAGGAAGCGDGAASADALKRRV